MGEQVAPSPEVRAWAEQQYREWCRRMMLDPEETASAVAYEQQYSQCEQE